MPSHTLSPRQVSAIRGLFHGQAVGDALGLGTEFMSKREVDLHYPQGLRDYSQIIRDAHRSRWQPGEWTDDTEQFLCLCDAIVETGGVDELAFARKLYAWYRGEPRGIGNTVLNVVSWSDFTEDPHSAARAIWLINDRESASNGAIMRSSLLGAHAFHDPALVAAHSARIARVTHWDDRCVGSCVLLTALIAHLLRTGEVMGAGPLREIAEDYDERIAPVIDLALEGPIEALRLDEEDSIGSTLKALSAGLWAWFHARDFEQGLLAVIHEGGDADTNGAVAGSLLGVKFGFESIPNRLVDGLLGRKQLEGKLGEFLRSEEELRSV